MYITIFPEIILIHDTKANASKVSDHLHPFWNQFTFEKLRNLSWLKFIVIGYIDSCHIGVKGCLLMGVGYVCTRKLSIQVNSPTPPYLSITLLYFEYLYLTLKS